MVPMNEAIEEYLGRGWSIIPIKRSDKRPLVRFRIDIPVRRAGFTDGPRRASGS
jgi:hypothetical protein